MNTDFDYGPNVEFNIETVGDMLKYYGDYIDQSDSDQYLLQAVCHMVYQIKDDIKASTAGVFKLKNFWIHYLSTPQGEEYSLYVDGMTAFHIIETGYHSFEFEFFSARQFQKAEALIDYAYNHRMDFGRAV